MDNKQYVLAIPNFSNGRDEDVIEAITGTLKKKDGVKLVSVEPEHDFNRTVVTIIGEPEPLKEALLNMAAKSYELIDMTVQKGSHPRIGGQDTIPLYPFSNISLDEVKDMAQEIGEELYERHGVPIFFAAENAKNEDRKSISFIRKGQYEGLKALLDDENLDEETREARKPDLSKDGKLDPKYGATIVSAEMEGLTAYNVFLDTEDVAVAKEIAKTVRGPSGGFSTVRAVGIKFPERTGTVVSMNMFDCGQTPLYRTFELIKLEAEKYGVRVTGSELVGPTKLEYLLNNAVHYLGLQGLRMDQILEMHLIG